MNNQPSYKRTIDWGRYVISFIITAAIFGSVLFISSMASNKQLDELRQIQDKVAIDLLSSETQFSLLSTAGCSEDNSSILAPEIKQLGERLSFMEEQLGADNEDVIGLKKYYSLLQIKDYMLVRELSKRCGFKPVTIVYFYSNEDCDDCTKQGYVLTALREAYPDLRVYSFDATLDLSAIKTLQTITKAPDEVPSLVINDKVFTGFQSIESIEKSVPELKSIKQKTAD